MRTTVKILNLYVGILKESSNKTSQCHAVCVYVGLRNEAWSGIELNHHQMLYFYSPTLQPESLSLIMWQFLGYFDFPVILSEK